MPMDIKPGYDEDLIKLLYDDVQELKKAKTNRSGDIFKGDLLVDGNLIVKGKVPGEDKVGQLYFGIDTKTPENVLPFNGAEKFRKPYPELWAKVEAGKLGPVVTDAVWWGGVCSGFSFGSTPDKFRMPDWRGIFMRFTGVNSVLKTGIGSYYEGGSLASIILDAMTNHSHGGWMYDGSGGAVNPGFAYTGGNVFHVQNYLSGPVDKGSGTPRTSTENRPVSVSINVGIYYKNIRSMI